MYIRSTRAENAPQAKIFKGKNALLGRKARRRRKFFGSFFAPQAKILVPKKSILGGQFLPISQFLPASRKKVNSPLLKESQSDSGDSIIRSIGTKKTLRRCCQSICMIAKKISHVSDTFFSRSGSRTWCLSQLDTLVR